MTKKYLAVISSRKIGQPFHKVTEKIFHQLKNKFPESNLIINNFPNGYSEFDDYSDAFLFDIMRTSNTHNFMKYRIKNKLNYFHLDHAYFWRGYASVTKNNNPHKCEWFRFGKNCHVLNKLLKVDDTRWKKYFYDHFYGYGKEYKKRGSKIIFCPSSLNVLSLYDQEKWVEETMETLKKNTDREIILRGKPPQKTKVNNISCTTGNTLKQDLEDCWALVTHSSCAAVEAQLLGIPTFSDVNSPSSPVSSSDYSSIESPFYPDDTLRTKWLNSLAYSQYSRNEIDSGEFVNNLNLFDKL